ncbi:membrane lipoprotein lipid attachment site-containing protein [Aerococcaceae bacterium DSM 111176]|nr:membrane lipoprotein lipid attachment site-containing protein [Aerococcaceae bacterium DSM 111176]
MKKYLLVFAALFILAGCQNERPTIEVDSAESEVTSSVEESSSSDESSESSESSSEEAEDPMVEAILESFEVEDEQELIEIEVVEDETTDAIPDPHTEYKIVLTDEEYIQTILDSVFRVHNGTASDEERERIRSIFDRVHDLAQEFDNDNDAVTFEFEDDDEETVLIAKSTRVDDYIEYDFDYRAESSVETVEEIEEPESEESSTETDTFIPQPTTPDEWQNNNNNTWQPPVYEEPTPEPTPEPQPEPTPEPEPQPEPEAPATSE